jgi:hypothetical protein
VDPPRGRPAAEAPGSIGFGAALGAGGVAGLVAAAAADCAGVLLYSATHPPVASATGSAWTAALAGGFLYWLLARSAAAPRRWLWAVALGAATALSLVELLLPAALGAVPAQGRVLAGLLEPAAQVLAAIGRTHAAAPAARAVSFIRGRFLLAAVVMHYAVAVATSLLVPPLSNAWSRRGQAVRPPVEGAP